MLWRTRLSRRVHLAIQLGTDRQTSGQRYVVSGKNEVTRQEHDEGGPGRPFVSIRQRMVPSEPTCEDGGFVNDVGARILVLPSSARSMKHGVGEHGP